MTFTVSIATVRETLDQQGSVCPIVGCHSEEVRIVQEAGSEEECGKEHFTCTTCTAEWTVMLYAAKIESIMLPDGNRYNVWNNNPGFEPGAMDQMACPKDPLITEVKEFIKQMRMGSVQKKGESLARLAHLVRMDLNSLGGTQPATLPTLPSDTE